MLVPTKQTTRRTIEAHKTDAVYSVSHCEYRAPRVHYIQVICTRPLKCKTSVQDTGLQIRAFTYLLFCVGAKICLFFHVKYIRAYLWQLTI